MEQTRKQYQFPDVVLEWVKSHYDDNVGLPIGISNLAWSAVSSLLKFDPDTVEGVLTEEGFLNRLFTAEPLDSVVEESSNRELIHDINLGGIPDDARIQIFVNGKPAFDTEKNKSDD